MIRPLNRPQLAATPCPCQAQASSMGSLTDTLTSIQNSLTKSLTSNWQTWALIAAAALAIYCMLQSTPKRQERAVSRRRARARYLGELEKIRQE